MSLPAGVIDKLLRKHFNGGLPMTVPLEERHALRAQIEQIVKAVGGIELEKYQRNESNSNVCNLLIRELHGDNSYATGLSIDINERNEVTIKMDSWRVSKVPEALVSSLAEVESFVVACHERLVKRAANFKKREKIRQLLLHGVREKVRPIVSRMQFPFYVEDDSIKIKVVIKLFNNDCVEIWVPFRHSNQSLAQLEDWIQAIVNLYRGGVQFRHIGTKWHREKWILPDNPNLTPDPP